MSEARFTKAGTYIVRYTPDTHEIEASDGEHNFAHTLEAGTDALVDYLNGANTPYPVQCAATVEGTKPQAKLTLVFSQRYEALDLNPATVELEWTPRIFPLVAWLGATCDQTRHLRSRIDDQATLISRQEKVLDEMIEAKQEHEKEMLEKFCAILNDRALRSRHKTSANVTPGTPETAVDLHDVGGLSHVGRPGVGAEHGMTTEPTVKLETDIVNDDDSAHTTEGTEISD